MMSIRILEWLVEWAQGAVVMKVQHSRIVRPILPWAPCALAAAVAAGAMLTPAPAFAQASPAQSAATDAEPALSSICTDRPTKSNYACTVDEGHFQYEADVANGSFPAA